MIENPETGNSPDHKTRLLPHHFMAQKIRENKKFIEYAANKVLWGGLTWNVSSSFYNK